MRFIGPRPALYNQDDLIKLRSEKGIDMFKPGITGWAQVNGRDNISIPEKVHLDQEYVNNLTLRKDIQIIFMTIIKVLSKESIKH
jgi:O-antigen biosynthesis protein WbqP